MSPSPSQISAKPDALPPIINISVFRRDVYFLSALLLADGQIAGLSGIKDAAEEHFDGEINRLLVLSSVSARHLLDYHMDKSPEISEKTANLTCGKYWTNYSETAPLPFRRACNAVIHAEEIAPKPKYAKIGAPKTATAPERTAYTGLMVIRGRHGKQNTRAELNCAEFAKCCIMLSDHFLED